MIYSRAFKALNISSTDAIVFEDALSGVQSAYNAKAGLVVAVEKPERTTAFKKMKEVNCVINDFTEIPKEVYDFLGISKK